MSTSVAMLKEFHGTRHFGNRENLLRQQAKAADLYRTLTAEEVDQLARFAIGGSENDTAVPRQEILLWLACLRPGSLVAFHDILVDHGRYYPAVIYHDAGSATAARVVNLLPGEDANNMLKALAWIGDAVVQDAFRRWRADPPGWADHLFVPPHRYAAEAAWELTPEGDRRDLFVRGCRPLVKPVEDPRTGVAQVVSDHEGACGWCGHRMTTLLDLNLSSSELGFLGLGGHRLRIATCLVCSCFGNLLTKIDLDGGSTWHAANRRPDYLPAPWRNGPCCRPAASCSAARSATGSNRRTGWWAASDSRRSADCRPGSRRPGIPTVRSAGERCRSSPNCPTRISKSTAKGSITCSPAPTAALRPPATSSLEGESGTGPRSGVRLARFPVGGGSGPKRFAPRVDLEVQWGSTLEVNHEHPARDREATGGPGAGREGQLLQWVVRDLGDASPGIESRPGVCGGEPWIVRTRIPVWVLEQSRRLGISEAELLRSYPSLRAEDLANAWAYVRRHRDEIDHQIRENEEA